MTTDTSDILRARLAGQSRRALADSIGVKYWDITDVLNGRAGRDRENRLRVALGLPPLPELALVAIDLKRQRVIARTPYIPRRRWGVDIV